MTTKKRAAMASMQQCQISQADTMWKITCSLEKQQASIKVMHTTTTARLDELASRLEVVERRKAPATSHDVPSMQADEDARGGAWGATVWFGTASDGWQEREASRCFCERHGVNRRCARSWSDSRMLCARMFLNNARSLCGRLFSMRPFPTCRRSQRADDDACSWSS